MFTLLALATSTAIADYRTLTECRAAIRQIYTQQVDPYHLMPRDTLKQVVDLQMRYSAPKDYVCLKRR